MRIDAVTLHQVAHSAWKRGIPVIPRLIDGLILLLFNSSIHYSTVIGRGSMASHRGLSIVVHRESVIGERVYLGPHVVLGSRRGDDPGPIIEDDVFISANAVILGRITVGTRAVIGAGAVVIEDVPPGATLVGRLAVVKGGEEARSTAG